MIDKPLKLELWKEFSRTELIGLGCALADALGQLDLDQDAKKSAAELWKKRIEEHEGNIGKLSRFIRMKGRDVPTDCLVRFHKPRIAFKQTVRLDTGEVIREEQMTPQECQENLFEAREVDELDRMMHEKPEEENRPEQES